MCNANRVQATRCVRHQTWPELITKPKRKNKIFDRHHFSHSVVPVIQRNKNRTFMVIYLPSSVLLLGLSTISRQDNDCGVKKENKGLGLNEHVAFFSPHLHLNFRQVRHHTFKLHSCLRKKLCRKKT